ncbi:hypothetical protein B0J13DRAFT_527156 [Dactylonectria estremocensis]|uniref:Uncharacterized protein n=1 Tax=Dactylonectria estremocensis TaxID=1079267 RepID=A0A9P9EMJ3_9HYPO|nr:hypothetical protein B0J13DRAFT_527156 [Dactylonectria estremocensis]
MCDDRRRGLRSIQLASTTGCLLQSQKTSVASNEAISHTSANHLPRAASEIACTREMAGNTLMDLVSESEIPLSGRGRVVVRVVIPGRNHGYLCYGFRVRRTDDGEQFMCRLHSFLDRVVWPHPDVRSRGFVFMIFRRNVFQITTLSTLPVHDLEARRDPVQVILSSVETAPDLSVAFRHPVALRGCGAFLEQHPQLSGTAPLHAQRAILISSELNKMAIGGLICISILLCAGVSVIVAVLTQSADRGLVCGSVFIPVVAVVEALLFWALK